MEVETLKNKNITEEIMIINYENIKITIYIYTWKSKSQKQPIKRNQKYNNKKIETD